MSTLPADIKHIVVLMLENRSFDNLLGKVPGVDGPGIQMNCDPKLGDSVAVSFDAGPVSPALEDPNNKGQFIGGPPHDFISVNRQLFEVDAPAADAKISLGGFVAAARQSTEDNADFISREVMKCFDTPNQLKTMAALAAEFMVCDHWYSSVPGPTWPNRLFTHCGTSFGNLDNTIRSYPGPTIYDRLSASDVSWAI